MITINTYAELVTMEDHRFNRPSHEFLNYIAKRCADADGPDPRSCDDPDEYQFDDLFGDCIYFVESLAEMKRVKDLYSDNLTRRQCVFDYIGYTPGLEFVEVWMAETAQGGPLWYIPTWLLTPNIRKNVDDSIIACAALNCDDLKAALTGGVDSDKTGE